MTKRIAAVAALVLLAACAPQPPVQDEVTVEFVKDDRVVVTAETTFDLTPDSDEARLRVDTARSAAISDTDIWSVRFARLSPEAERLILDKDHGDLERVSRSVRIPTRDLQQVFSDANITVHVLQGEGWKELTFYPGGSSRASREQQARFRDDLETWSGSVARYFGAVHRMYAYMDRNPTRAEVLFDELLETNPDDIVEVLLAEEEQPLIDDLLGAMEDIASRMDQQNGRAATISEDADMIYNPFPGRVTVELPGEIVSSEGFEIRDKRAVIEPVSLFDAITRLEGRWISPDPLAALLRDQTPKAEELARKERRSTSGIDATEVANALREQLVRPKTYVVRWRD
ncbi:MAG TPA: hypothetical protein VEK57_19850 [Thermoanaerobaculia bacterium]|nr:hypothetical protein [Thermoanaerobaculia bacterium]